MECSDSASTPSTTWHIVWQTVEGRDLLAHPALAERIRLRLLDAHRPLGRALLHYLVTPRELHLLSRLPAAGSPGDVARAIGSSVARWVRQAQTVPGIVFAGRYRAYVIDSEEAEQNEFRMLAWRPVRLRLCKAPTHHGNSSLRATLGLARAKGFESLAPLCLFGNSVPEARNALRRRIAMRPDAAELHHWELTRGLVLVPRDSETFARMTRPGQGMAAALVAACQPPGISGALGLLERWMLLKLGYRDVPGLDALPVSEGARGRALVAGLAVRLDLCSAATTARHFNRSKATLSEGMAACRLRPSDRSILDMPLRRIVEEALYLR